MRSSPGGKLRRMKTKQSSSKKIRKTVGEVTIGIDIGDQWSHYCTLSDAGEVIEEGRFRTTAAALGKHFADIDSVRIALENGTHSIWINEQLRGYGHEVIVANVRELHAICRNDRKSDRVDAEKLARFARIDPNILRPITHRSVALQESLTIIRARDVLVRVRAALVNATRGLAKPCGFRLPKCSTRSFHKRCLMLLPEGLKPALKPLIDQIEQVTAQIEIYNERIEEMTKQAFPETQALVQVPGVGALTAITFVLTVGDKNRFQKSRDVGSYIGLRPRRDQSGSRDPQLGITKAGNGYLRSLLVECANHILGRFGKDSALRRWGLHLMERGGKNARKKALVAVARKLAVLLHKLWVTQEQYSPFYGQQAA
jgi:transposase